MIFLRCDKLSTTINVYERCIIVIVTCANLCVIFRTVTYRQLQLVYIISMMTSVSAYKRKQLYMNQTFNSTNTNILQIFIL